MTDLVRVAFRKYDGSLHWNMTMRRLGEDEHGVWLGLPVGGVYRKGNGPAIPVTCPNVGLIPHHGWWAATFNAEPRSSEIYVDVATPAVWRSAAEVTMTDLDLDVVRKRGERAPRLLDADEFAEHQVRYAYSPDVIARAEEAAQWLMKAVGDGTEPFAKAYLPWLRQVTA
jgi:protein associated with RNAse G/E